MHTWRKVGCCLVAAVAGLAQGATYYLNEGQLDPSGTSSLSGTGAGCGTWTNEAGGTQTVPTAGNDYVAADFCSIRSPNTASTFQGDSLVLAATGKVEPVVSNPIVLGLMADFIVPDLTIRNSGVSMYTTGDLGLAGKLTIPSDCEAWLGLGCAADRRFALQADLKGEGTAVFPLNAGTVTSLTGDNSGFHGDVTLYCGEHLGAQYDGVGKLRFYSATSWFGDGGHLCVGADTITLRFEQDMTIQTPNRIVDFGAHKPIVWVEKDKTVVLNAQIVGSNGFVKDGEGTLYVDGYTAGLSGDIETRAGQVLLRGRADLALSVGSRALILTYCGGEQFKDGSAWLAFGKGDAVPDQVPDSSFRRLRSNLAAGLNYRTAEQVEEGCAYWLVLRFKSAKGEVKDIARTFEALGAEYVFRRDGTADADGTTCFLTPSKWLDAQGAPVSQFDANGDYCVDSDIQNRTFYGVDGKKMTEFTGHSVVFGSEDRDAACYILARGLGLDADVLVVGKLAFMSCQVETCLNALAGLLWLQDGSSLSLEMPPSDTPIAYTINVSSSLSGWGKAIMSSSDTGTHTIRLSGDNGGLSGPVEFAKGVKDLTIVFRTPESWFGDMAAPTPDGLKITGGTTVKFDASLVGKTPNRGIDLIAGSAPVAFDVSEGERAELNAPVRGNGFVKTGRGTLSLTSDQLKGVTGTVQVLEGVLEIPSKRSFANGTVLDVAEGAEVRYTRKSGLAIMLY